MPIQPLSETTESSSTIPNYPPLYCHTGHGSRLPMDECSASCCNYCPVHGKQFLQILICNVTSFSYITYQNITIELIIWKIYLHNHFPF